MEHTLDQMRAEMQALLAANTRVAQSRLQIDTFGTRMPALGTASLRLAPVAAVRLPG